MGQSSIGGGALALRLGLNVGDVDVARGSARGQLGVQLGALNARQPLVRPLRPRVGQCSLLGCGIRAEVFELASQAHVRQEGPSDVATLSLKVLDVEVAARRSARLERQALLHRQAPRLLPCHIRGPGHVRIVQLSPLGMMVRLALNVARDGPRRQGRSVIISR